MLLIKKYEVRNPLLKRLVKYFWVIDSQEHLKIDNTLLPVSNIDFILNFSAPIRYSDYVKEESITYGFHFNGIIDKFRIIKQEGKLEVIGVSFYTLGLYALIQMPIVDFRGVIIHMSSVLSEFTQKLGNRLIDAVAISEKLNILEEELLKYINIDCIPSKKVTGIYNTFFNEMNSININDFCIKYGVNQRSLERLFNKYVGTSPKEFHRITRFQYVVNQLLEHPNQDLTFLAHQNNYYDQNHFLKEFKAFTGYSPTKFIQERRSVKQIM